MKNMKKRLLLIMTVLSALALAMTGIVAAQQAEQDQEPATPGQQDQDNGTAVVVLDEVGGSGVKGVAVMHGQGQQQTQIVVVALAESDLLGSLFGNGAQQQYGPVAILSGTCEDPQEIVEELGELQPLMQAMHQQQQPGQQSGGPQALAATVSMGLDEILTGGYVIAILDVESNGIPTPGQPELPGATPTPGVPGVTPDPMANGDISTLACGELAEDSRMGPTTPTPGVPTIPGVMPTPVEPMPTPIVPEQPAPAPGI